MRWPNLNHDISSPPVEVKRSYLWFLLWLNWKEILPHKVWPGILINQPPILFLDWMTNQNLNSGRDTVPTDVDKQIWLSDLLKSSKSIQNDLWLVSQSGMFVPRGIPYKNKCFRVRWEKTFDVHTKEKRIRKEICSITEASSASHWKI